MGIVIPFTGSKRATSQHLPELAAISAGVDQDAVLTAARPILDLCRDRYGVVVMRDGLPRDPAALGNALVTLTHALRSLDADMQAPRRYPSYGVYFGKAKLAWFEDGYSGETGLAVPTDVALSDLTEFLRPRFTVARGATTA